MEPVIIEDGYYDLIDSIDITNQLPTSVKCQREMYSGYAPIELHPYYDTSRVPRVNAKCVAINTPLAIVCDQMKKNRLLYPNIEIKFDSDSVVYLLRKPRSIAIDKAPEAEDDMFDEIFSDSESSTDSEEFDDTSSNSSPPTILTDTDDVQNFTSEDQVHPLSTSEVLKNTVESWGYSVRDSINIDHSTIIRALKNKVIPRLHMKKMKFLTDVLDLKSCMTTEVDSCRPTASEKDSVTNLNMMLPQCEKNYAYKDLRYSPGYHKNKNESERKYQFQFYQDIRIRSNLPLKVWVFLMNRMVEIGRGREITIDAMTDSLVQSMYVEIDRSRIDSNRLWKIVSGGETPYISFDYYGLADSFTATKDSLRTSALSERIQKSISRDLDLMISYVESDCKKILVYAKANNVLNESGSYDRAVLLRAVDTNREVNLSLAEIGVDVRKIAITDLPTLTLNLAMTDTGKKSNDIVSDYGRSVNLARCTPHDLTRDPIHNLNRDLEYDSADSDDDDHEYNFVQNNIDLNYRRVRYPMINEMAPAYPEARLIFADAQYLMNEHVQDIMNEQVRIPTRIEDNGDDIDPVNVLPFRVIVERLNRRRFV
jgi:hypothetical protein